MVCLVRLRDLHRIALINRRFKCFLCFFQCLHIFFRHALARQLNRQFLQRTAHFQHIFQTFFRNPRHLRAAPWNHQNEPFQLQLADRLTDRGAADAQLLCQLDLHQALARCQLSL